MKLYFLVTFLFLAQLSIAQNINMIIEVNEELVTTISGAHLNFTDGSGNKSKNLIGYYPGELVLNKEDWEMINSPSTKSIKLSFVCHGLKKSSNEGVFYEISMDKSHFDKRYLILNIYDFSERKFRKRYSCLTEEDYIFEFNYPQGGILISCK